MLCHLCQQEAVGRCYTCGQLFCAAHGSRNCTTCDTAIAPGDRRPDRISAAPTPPLQEGVKGTASRGGAWWRPLPAEDFEPPACYQCKGLARRTCRNCGQLYCGEHAGQDGLCAACDRSSWVGLYLLAGLVLLIITVVLLGG